MKTYGKVILLFTTSIIVCFLLTSQGKTDDLDTTRVRKTEKIKKSTGEIIADIPGELLKLPFYAIEFATHTILYNPPVSYATKMITLGAEAKPYIPIVGYGSISGLKFGFGLRRLKNIIPTDFVKGKWYYSTNKYQSYKFEARSEQLFSDQLGLDFYFRYKKRPRESFYGIGINSRKDKEANYTFENTEIKIELPFRALDKIYFSLIGGYQISNLYDGQDPNLEGNLGTILIDPDFALESGRLDDSRYITFGASFEWDGRDNRGQPSNGIHTYASFLRYSGVSRSEGQGFNKFTVDLRKYFNIWRKRILAVRVYLQRFDADHANTQATPLYLTSSLGGRDALRGYSQGRFIDNDLALIAIEYRYPIYKKFDAFLFHDEGRVYNKITNEVFFADWKSSTGFGIRVRNDRSVVALFQIALSEETTKLYFELGAVW